MTKKLLLLPLLLTSVFCLPSTPTHADDATTIPPIYYNVRSYGATGDGKTLDSDAINKAIDAAAAAGGGTVFVPAGQYLCGSIHLKSNIDLHLSAGSNIIGAPQAMNAYDETEEFESQGPAGGPRVAYQDGGHCYFHNSLIWGEKLDNVSITGTGMISGARKLPDGKWDNGLVSGDAPLDRMCGINNFNKGASNTGANTPATEPAADAAAEPKPIRLGNKAIALKLCKNVTLKDVTIAHGGHFAILTTGCDGLTVDNVTMDTNRDGFDIDACRNVMVSNCRINSPGDDGLCPKSTFALGENRIEENMVITNCQVSGWVEGTLLDGTMKPKTNGNGRLKFGTEASGGFRNITISNIVFRGCRGLALEEVDGGTMENITISNITMMDTWSYPIYLTTGKRNRSATVEHPSIMRNILISNVIATGIDPKSGIQIAGLPDNPLQGIRLENIRLEFKGGGTAEQGATTPKELATGYPEPGGPMPGYALFARHVKDLEMSNIRYTFDTPDLRPAMVCIDIDDLELDNIKAQVADGVKIARFEKVTNDVIRNSPALQADGAIDRKAEASEPTPTAPRPKRQKPADAPAATPAAAQ